MACSCGQNPCAGGACSAAGVGGGRARGSKAIRQELDELKAMIAQLHGTGAVTMAQQAPPSTVPQNGHNGHNGYSGPMPPTGCTQQSAACMLCQDRKPGIADCDLEQWLEWACAGPQITTQGLAAVDGTPNTVWVVDSTARVVAHYYQTPHAGIVCLKTLTLEMDPAGGTAFTPITAELNVFMIPAEVAIDPDGEAAGTWVDYRGRRGPRNSAAVQLKLGRCECDTLCAACVFPNTASALGGGYLLAIEGLDAVAGFVPGTSTLKIGHRLMFWKPDDAEGPCACKCPEVTLPCGRKEMGECIPATDLLALSKSQDNWEFCP